MEESLNLKDYVIKSFGEAKTNPKEYSPLALAFIGDAVYSLVIRTIIVDRGNVPVNRLHKETTSLVKAEAQAAVAEALHPLLTQEEEAIYRRGRNAKSGSSAKNASIQDYRKATGMEALTGYLYLKGDMERIVTLLKMGMELTGQYGT
ncbi:ribonuclease III [bacterium C-53]|nr:ribonuclease III [Lachnospiraceae bacterium]NBI03403.1 ribonuclease III [Lachnospiraceae bacterium]RKJ09648.1 ribonuclease III [bacterium C-53]